MPVLNQQSQGQYRSRGEFDNNINYDTDDRVGYQGDSYVALMPIPAGQGPPNPGVNGWINDPGSPGETGRGGTKGNYVLPAYLRSVGIPSPPTAMWNGVDLLLAYIISMFECTCSLHKLLNLVYLL